MFYSKKYGKKRKVLVDGFVYFCFADGDVEFIKSMGVSSEIVGGQKIVGFVTLDDLAELNKKKVDQLTKVVIKSLDDAT